MVTKQELKRALAELGVLQHQILTDKKVGDLLAAAAGEDLNDVEQANLREMTRALTSLTMNKTGSAV